MASPVTVTERDLRTLLGIAGDERGDLPAAGLPLSLLAELKDQIPCDHLAFERYDTGRQTGLFGQHIPADGDDSEPDIRLFWKHYWDSLPCCYPDRTGDLRSVTKSSDFYSVRQWHNTGMYRDWVRSLGLEHEMMLCLPAGHLRTIRLLFWRGPGPDFPTATARCWRCCARTCTRPTWTPNAAVTPYPPSLRGRRSCCGWWPPGTPTPRSPAASA
jgi:hypothetical protein